LSILKQRTTDEEVKKYAQSLMRAAGSLIHTREKCKALKLEITEQVEKLGGNAPLMKLIEALDVQVEGLESAVAPPQATMKNHHEGYGNKDLPSPAGIDKL
jgi:hypothetical protein